MSCLYSVQIIFKHLNFVTYSEDRSCRTFTFIGEFAKFCKATIRFVMSVLPSVCLLAAVSSLNNSFPTETFSQNLTLDSIFSK